MAVLASVAVEGSITSSEGFVTTIDTVPVTNPNGAISHTRLLLVNGNNTIVIPAGARGVIITFSVDNPRIRTLKGVAGDTGILMSSGGTKTFMLLFGSGVAASFIIANAASGDVNFTEFFFF